MTTYGKQASRTDDPGVRERPRAAEGKAATAGQRSFRHWLERFGALAILILAIALFSALRPETFPTIPNAKAILVSQSVLVLLTLGLLVPLTTGEFDLSIGFVMSFSTMVVGVVTAYRGWNPVLAIAAALGLALLIGAVNGLLIVYARVHSLIATLGTGTILSGLTTWISQGQIIQGGLPREILWLGRTEVAGIEIAVYSMLLVAIVFAVVLSYTQFGRFLYAVGGGREVARLAGVRTNRLVVLAFMISAGTASLAAFVGIGLAGSAHPDVGSQYLLPAFAAAFLGATTIVPGRFNVWGTVVAIFLLAVLVAGLQQLGAPFWVSPVFNGTALIVAVALARLRE